MYSIQIRQLMSYLVLNSHKINPRSQIFKPYINEIYKLTYFLSNSAKINERIYCIINNITSQSKCNYCKNNNVIYSHLSGLSGYKKYCSKQCANTDTREKVKLTCISKYGTDNPFKVKEIQDKCQSINPFKSKKGQKIAKQKIIEKYGEDYKRKILEKAKITNLQRYGYEIASKNENIKIKILKNRFGKTLSCNIGKHEKELLDKQEKIDNCIIIRNFIIGPYRPDGYCKESNTIYEVYERFHRWSKNKIKDKQRQNYIQKELNCNFIIIWDI